MTHITLPRAIVEQVRQALTVLLDHLDGVPADKVALADWIQAEADLCSALAEDALDRLAENERALGIQMEAPRAALAQQADTTDPGRDVDVLREHVRHLERRIRELHAQQAEPLTIERLRYALVASRIIPPAAVEDPDEYDDGVTLFRIEALHRRIT